jgi:hypothetical protein
MGEWEIGWEGVASADEISQLMLTWVSHSPKWQTTHFPLSAADLSSIGWSGNAGKLSDTSLSLLNWFCHRMARYWGLSCHSLRYSLRLSWCWWCQ